jgi:hypothetical protein
MPRSIRFRTGARLLAALLVTTSVLPSDAEAQLLKRLRATAEQSIDDRKLAAEDEIVLGAGERVGAVVEFGARPVVGLLDDAVAGLDSLAVRIVRGLGGGPGLEGELRDGLAAGGVDLELGFVPGSGEPDSAASDALEALASVIRETSDQALLEGRVFEGEPAGMGRVRAEVVRTRLVAAGVEPERLFVVSRTEPEAPVMLGVRYLR